MQEFVMILLHVSTGKEALYGSLDPTTLEWTDGIFTKVLREASRKIPIMFQSFVLVPRNTLIFVSCSMMDDFTCIL